MEKTLLILRGLPGSGKSTLASNLTSLCDDLKAIYLEADMFFIDDNGGYKFDISKLNEAHNWVQSEVKEEMLWGRKLIIVSNTSTTGKELQPYYDLAKQYNYKVISTIVENRHNGVNIHNVPENTLKKMKERFEIKL